MQLYHYVHCPFCVRIRMVLGFLNIDYTSTVLAYNDEEKPIALTGKKMLPIMEINGVISNESLDIIKSLDKEDKLDSQVISNNYGEIEGLLNKIGADVHSLAMPYWCWSSEFDIQSRNYFMDKKEAKRGSFSKLVQNQKKYIDSLNETLEVNTAIFDKEITSDTINLTDILIAAHLWGMYVVPEFQFSQKMHHFLQSIREVTRFNYHQDFWT